MAKQFHFPDSIPIPHYKTIYYMVENTVNMPYISAQDIYDAAQQAAGIWAAVTPVIFLRRSTYVNGDVHINLNFVDTGAENGNGTIDINTYKAFFIERFRNYNNPPVPESKGPYDLVGTICHEIGHNVFGYINPPDPWEDNKQIDGGMMRGTMAPGQVLRNLVAGDINFAHKKFGSVPQPVMVPLHLENAEQIEYSGSVNYAATAAQIAISGDTGSSSIFQVYETAVKGKMINAVNITARLDSGNAVINRVEVYDGAFPVEVQVLSFSTYTDASKEVTLKVGFSGKPVFNTGMLFRIEVLFSDTIGYNGSGTAACSLSITGLTVEEIPRPILMALP